MGKGSSRKLAQNDTLRIATPCPSLITVVLQFDKENSLTILSNVQLLHSPTQRFLPTKAQLCSLCILQAANPSCHASPHPQSQSLGESPCPDYPISQHCSGFYLLSCLKRCSDPLHGSTIHVKRGGGELHPGVKMARKSLRGRKT